MAIPILARQCVYIEMTFYKQRLGYGIWVNTQNADHAQITALILSAEELFLKQLNFYETENSSPSVGLLSTSPQLHAECSTTNLLEILIYTNYAK